MLLQLKKPHFETFVVLYLAGSYFANILNLMIRFCFGVESRMGTFFVAVVLLILLMTCISDGIKQIRVWQVSGIFAVIFILAFFSVFASSDSGIYDVILGNILTKCLPIFFCGAWIVDYGKVRNGLIHVMTVIPYCYLMLFVLGVNTLAADQRYSQYYGYIMLFVVVVLTSALVERLSFAYLIPLGISLFFMVAYGARGPVACWGLYILLQVITKFNWKNCLNTTGILAVLCAVGTVMYENYYEISLWCKFGFEKIGFSVRVIDRLLDGSFFDDSARHWIADICVDKILDNPIIGTGPVNDRIYISEKWAGGGENIIGCYPHNIFLEFLMQYGVIFGGILLLAILWLLIKSYCVSLDNSTKELLLVLIGTYFFPLLFSGSYLDRPGFYFLIAVCLNILANRCKIITTR